MRGGRPEWEKFSQQELQEKIENSKTIKEFIKSLGYNAYRSDIKNNIVRKYPNLDFSKFTNGIFQDLTKETFGKLTVIERDLSKTDQVWWKCRCECGNFISIRAYSLKDKNHGVKSCGCLLEESRYNKIKKLDGQKFGHLTVIERDYSISDNRVRYLCECDCVNRTKVIVLADNLRRNHTTSCGCILSLGEERVQIILSELGINFKKEYSFKDLLSKRNCPLRFDFAIFDNNDNIIGLIECQGQQHYTAQSFFGGEEQFYKQKENDSLKKEYCVKNNIPLYEIPYWDYTKISKEYIQDLIK